MLKAIYNGVTLENLSNGFYGLFLDQLILEGLFDESEKDIRLAEIGIEYSNIFQNMGIFGLCFGLFLLMILVYFVTLFAAERIKCCRTVKDKLQSKLFYNLWIRYMIESYLKNTHYFVFFLAINASFDSNNDKIRTWILIAFLALYLLWPLFIILFLYKKQKVLDDKNFIKKFQVMYHENKINRRVRNPKP